MHKKSPLVGGEIFYSIKPPAKLTGEFLAIGDGHL